MASIRYIPFTIETKALHINNHRRPRLCWHRNSLNFAAPRVAGTLHSRNGGVCGGRFSFSSARTLRATPNDAAEGNESGESPEDSLQATIEKSKKVLAMQRDLLNQISSKRKLISSIRSSNNSSVEDGSLVKENGDRISYPEGPSTSNASNVDELAEDKRKPNLPQNVTGGTKEKTYPKGSKRSPTKIISATEEKKEADPPHYQPQKKNVNLGPVKTDVLPPFVSELVAREEKLVGYEEASLQVRVRISDEKTEPTEEEKPPLAGANAMNIILVAAECAPWSKTGGLGDVAGALPKALARRGHRVMVVVPRYGDYAEAQESGVRRRYKVAGQDMEVSYFHAFIDGVDFVFINSPVFRHIENNIYGGKREDILKRMVLFCKAAVEVPWYVPCGGVCYGDGNLVFVANDWHTALLPVYLKAYYRDNGLMSYTRSVIVIHNIAHQGRGPLDDFSLVDLPGNYIDLFRMYDPVGGDHFNIFAAGLKAADRVVTVSHGYAWEVKTQEGGWGLHKIINENDWKLRGIVNGIDTEDWSPEFDRFLTSDGYTNYTLETLRTGKLQCKVALQKELGLPVREDVPLIGFIGRLDHQKGVDLIAEAVPWMMNQDVQLVMLGTGRSDLEQMLREFENQHRDRVRGWVGFSVKVAHRITAGSDILLMPSRFEPCGLNQLYAMNYGTVPVVHAVGGLRDTVQPFDPFTESGLGWTFDRAESGQLVHALGNCLLTYRQYKESWVGIQTRGMMQDLSWDHAAQIYEEVLVAAKYQW